MKLIHDSEAVIALVTDDANVQTTKTVFSGTKDECQEEAARLNLIDPHNVFRVVTAPVPTAAPSRPTPPGVPLSKYAFLTRFTSAERIAAQASADPVVQDFLNLLNVAQNVSLSDPNTIAGVNYIEKVGIIAAGRAAVILAA